MKKTALALASMVMLTPAAFAQKSDSITLYGLIDMGFMHDKTENGAEKNELNSGIRSGSRFGVKGTEDLGNGLKAIFLLENGFQADTGEAAQDGRLFGRWAYVGIAGKFGEIRAGRQWNLGREWGGSLTPFGISWGRSALGTTFGYNDGDFGASGIVDNMVMWRSEKLNNFEFAAGYSTAIDRQENPGFSNNDRLLTAGGRYRNGPINLVVTYEQLDVDQRRVKGKKNPAKDASNLQIGGYYDFNPLRVYLGFGRVEDANKGPAKGLDHDNAWTVGARYPIGKGHLIGSWQQTNTTKITMGSIGYEYDLSKRSSIYTFFNQGDTRNLSTSEDTWRRQFSLGMVHKF